MKAPDPSSLPHWAISSGEALPIRLPIRSAENVRTWLIFTHDRFGNRARAQLEREREARSLRLTGDGDRDHRARTFIEDVEAQDEDRTPAGLFVSASRTEVGPAYLSSQYSGDDAISADNPSSAIALCSERSR